MRGLSQSSMRWLDWGSLFIITAIFLWPSWISGSWPGTGVDLYGTVWFYGWVRQSVEQLFDPSFTNWFFYPDGKDIFAHTGNNLIDAYLSIPFQWLFGEYFIAPFVTTLLMLNVIGLRWFLRENGIALYLRWLLSLLWLFNPYVLSELAMGRPTQILLFPSLFALVFSDRMVNGDQNAWIGLGCMVAFQGWCYWFYGYFLVLFLTVLWVARWFGGRVRLSEICPHLVKSILLCSVLIAPAIWTMGRSVSNDAVPGVGIDVTLSLAGIHSQLAPWTRGFQLFEPVGHPYFRTVLWGGCAILTLLKPFQSLKWIVASFCLFLCALGPAQSYGDATVLNPLYLYLVQILPFLERLWFPYRAMAFVFTGVVIHCAVVLHSFKLTSLQRIVLPVLIFLGGLFDAWYVHSLPLTHTKLPKSSVEQCLEGPTIQIPNGFVHPTMTWQIRQGVPYFGGMGENGLIFLPNGYKRRLQNPFIQSLKSASLYPNASLGFSPFDKERIIETGFQFVLWDRSMTEMELVKRQTTSDRPEGLFTIQRNLIEMLGNPICSDRQWLVFALEPIQKAMDSAIDLNVWDWEQPGLSGYERRLKELGLVPN